MMEKKILIAMLFLLTVGLTACGNNDNDYDENGYTVAESEATYEQDETDAAQSDQQSNSSDQLPENPEVSLEQAIQIAYEDLEERGITATFRKDSGMGFERGQWVWELLFVTEGEGMPYVEYYISVDDGSIVKFEWDD